jgi:H+-translocating NAD(P) transhydrogenase subunit alpha
VLGTSQRTFSGRSTLAAAGKVQSVVRSSVRSRMRADALNLNYNPELGRISSVAPWHPSDVHRSDVFGGSLMPAPDMWAMLFVFVLATFVGFQVIQNVSRLLHTPLMSLTNAISAIAVVGSIIIAGEQHSTFATILGTVAVAASMTNIVSGFLITDRMLRMFRERRRQ